MKKFQIYTRCIVFNKDNQVLLVQKNTTQRIATGKWLLPGGTVEWGEDIEATLIRETKEEVGMDISIHSILGTRTILLEEDHWIGIYFFASGDVSKAFNAEPEKHDAIWFFSFSKLPEDIPNEEKVFIKTALDYKNI